MRVLASIHEVGNDQDTYHIYRKEKKRREEKKRKGKERNEMGTKAHKVCENSKCGFWGHMYLFVHI